MTRTYTRTLLMNNDELQKCNVKITVFKSIKYYGGEIEEELEYTGLTAWDIIEGGEDADEIEKSGLLDEEHEYLVLHFNDGNRATFRNSYTDMHIR